MAASPVLVDSSFYIRCLRGGRDPLRALALTAASRDLVTCGIIRCEVARGVRDPAVHRRFQAFWDSMINISLDDTIWKTTEETLWRLDRAGVILPLADVAIACCARVAGAVVLTCDFHFRRIPGTRVIEELEY